MIRFIKYLFKVTGDGFYFLCSTISKGFFYYFYAISSFIERIFKFLKSLFKKLQMNPAASFVIIFVFLVGVFAYTHLYSSGDDAVKVKLSDIKQDVNLDKDKDHDADESPSEETKIDIETNLFRRYGKTSLDQVNIAELKNVNPDTVSWITVDNTNINYPVVKTSNNDFYLNHDFNKTTDSNGWTFMDYRNNPDMSNDNTIFYGHNLLNKTSFGSISNLFTEKWFRKSNHNIIVITASGRYVYQIFSVYYSEPVTDYLQTNFSYKDQYLLFLNDLKSKSKFNFNIDMNENDKIITLSTCTEDNKGRKVVHAKLVG